MDFYCILNFQVCIKNGTAETSIHFVINKMTAAFDGQKDINKYIDVLLMRFQFCQNKCTMLLSFVESFSPLTMQMRYFILIL